MSLSPDTRERIQTLIESSEVFLFMKGNPASPQCGFSSQVVQLLDRLVPSYSSCDVLQEPEIRDGIKEFSDWPTIPQLYLRGEFMGGCDIITEMYASGELQEALGLPAPDGKPPVIAVSAEAAEELRAARERAGEAELHLSIDARNQSSLGLGPAQPEDVQVSVAGLRLFLDRETALRAEGVTIDVIDTPEGRQLAIDNPNQAKVGQLAPAELRAWTEAGESFEFVDVRTQEERAAASIAGTRLHDPEERRRLEALPRATRLVFHCHTGSRSQAAAEHYAALGFTQVFNLAGGIDAWSQEIDPSVPRY